MFLFLANKNTYKIRIKLLTYTHFVRIMNI
nr:MAG TPA: hypothetical protein [Caudoviricetes sp.]DAN81018.1 MAG TPA: hypothetical protein [Caudoviricetes sp.]DAO06734.1 MAG TPA: hypothetical protein [Caudoviricetes sp.]DAO57145.1 MAG TPA: hypothetical protein [Caudoviricetes sp.]DAU52705.1 MAG TPA: hypothetical protein [Caudoviricetes sp.]